MAGECLISGLVLDAAVCTSLRNFEATADDKFLDWKEASGPSFGNPSIEHQSNVPLWTANVLLCVVFFDRENEPSSVWYIIYAVCIQSEVNNVSTITANNQICALIFKLEYEISKRFGLSNHFV